MDITDNLEEIISESNYETTVSPETREDEITSNASHLDDILTDTADDEVQDIKNMSDEQIHLKSDIIAVSATVPNKEEGGGDHLSTCVTTDPVITSTNVRHEISTGNKPLIEYLNVPTNNDKIVKSSNDKENNSDMLDEELQLRWDDDDNVIGSEEEEELLQEKPEICEEIAEKQFTDNKELDLFLNDVIEEKLVTPIPDKSGEDYKDISIQKTEEIITQHGLKKPDMMLEIPTQELMDFMDEDDGPDLLSNLEMSLDNQKGENNTDQEDKVDDNLVTTNPITASIAELQFDNVESITTKNVQMDSKEYEDIIDADVSESNEKKQAEVNTEIVSTHIVDTFTESIETKSDENQRNVDKVADEPQPSTSKSSLIMEMRRDSDEVGEMSDSLGLLAESTRVLEDNDDQEEDEDDDDGDDDEDLDPDEENSNQMAAEYSEDSSAVNSESDIAKAAPTDSDNAKHPKDIPQTDFSLSDEQNETCEFSISDIKSQDDSNKNVIETIDQMEWSDVTLVQAEENDEDNEEMGEKMILEKVVEQEYVELSRSPAENLNIDNDDVEEDVELSRSPAQNLNIDNVEGDVSNKLQEESEQGIFVIEDENSITVNETLSPTAVPELESKKDDNVVLLESSSEEELNDEKENTSNILPEKKIPRILNDLLSSSKECSSEKKVEKVGSDKITSPKTEKKQVSKAPIGLEVFNVDSDEDEVELKKDEVSSDKVEKLPGHIICVNPECQSSNDTKFFAAQADLLKFYEMEHKKKAAVCETCANEFSKHIQELLNRFKNFTPLLDLDTGKSKKDLVEIYDSESEDEEEEAKKIEDKETIDTSIAKFLEDNLADVFNKSWEKYKMDSRLDASTTELQQELNTLQLQTKEIDKMLSECQEATDQLRNNLYATFEVDRRELPAIALVDTPNNTYCCYEDAQSKSHTFENRVKRRMTANTDTPAKRLAVRPGDKQESDQDKKIDANALEPVDDDNMDVSVVKLSAEAAPPDLPPPGELSKPALRVGMPVYAMKTTFGIWIKAKIVEVQPKSSIDQCSKASVSDRGVFSEANNTSTDLCDTNFPVLPVLPKKVIKRSRESLNDKNMPKVKKVPKTGAERIRAYRARILAYEREVAARCANNVANQIVSQQNLENNQIPMSKNQPSLLHVALTRPAVKGEQDARHNHQQFFIEVEIPPHALPPISDPPNSATQMQSGTQVGRSLRKLSSIAKTSSERVRAYRERKKTLKNDANLTLMSNTTHSHMDDAVMMEKEYIVEPSSDSSNSSTLSTKFTMCRVKFEYKVDRNPFKQLPSRCLAYSEPPDVRLAMGTRIIASAGKTDSFYSGVVAEVPNPVNKYRYLVFFDDGHAKYVQHAHTRLVCEWSPQVWEEVHPYSQDFVRQYLSSFPDLPMVRLRPKQHLKTEWQGKWWPSRVLQVDASLVEIQLAGDRREWIYRGSTRLAPLYLELQAAERHRARPMPRSGPQIKSNMPYVEYTRYDEPFKSSNNQTAQQNEEMRRQRAVAKKSTATSQMPLHAPPANSVSLESVISRVVHYKPKNAVCPLKMVPHECGPHCRRTDVLPLKDLRTYNPLAKPLLSGWERQLVRYKAQNKQVMYRAPCGRRLRNMRELHRYLRAVRSEMAVDLFDFSPNTHCLAEFVLNNCLVGKKDLSHGKENVPVPCVNYYDESLPEFCSYNTERTPTAGVPLNLDPDFLCGCDCEDDCQDKSKCACWKMTLEGARTIGLDGDVGYVYRRLPEPLPTGIYECNSRCKCSNTCLNRVAQHPLQLKLQVFKTQHRGWGIRALNDVPKGSFLCVYAGNLLTDATANLDGLNEGDEYLAELDYIEVVEQMKEGYEEDIPEALKETDKNSSNDNTAEEDESSEEETESKNKLSKDEQDDDFRPSYVDVPIEFNKRLRTREKRKREKRDDTNKEKENEKGKEKEVEQEAKKEVKKEAQNENGDEDCITISDDEEVREPSRFTVQAGMDSKQLVSKYRSVRSYFGEDEACYIMDAKVQGNIGRYLNHSCLPNVFVQNVFVDTHDPRFPWVAFFALAHIRAGTELTWNYNYDVGSVPGKVLYCYCGANNCRGRLL